MRETSLKMVHELAKRDPRVVFVGSDLGAGVLDAMRADEIDRLPILAGLAQQGLVAEVEPCLRGALMDGAPLDLSPLRISLQVASVAMLLVAPVGTPQPVVVRLNEAMRAALAAKDVQENYERQGATTTPTTPEELGRQFEPSAQCIRNWVRQAERDEGRWQALGVVIDREAEEDELHDRHDEHHRGRDRRDGPSPARGETARSRHDRRPPAAKGGSGGLVGRAPNRSTRRRP